ncbi:MAG: glycosyltransferase [Acidimicrobiales bacterium]
MPRPRWSVMVPTCDDGDLLVHALRSVLDQGLGADLHLEVIDDASRTCDVRSLVAGVAGDQAEVTVHPRRWGAAATFTHCIQRARGELVHILHADDWVLPGCYEAYDAALRAHPEAEVAVARSWFVDGAGEQLGLSGELEVHDGLLVDAERAIAMDNPVNFVGFVVARRAYEAVGGFDPELPHANDWDMWTRLAHRGPIAVVPGVHACYRRHEGSDTTRLQGSMGYLADPVEALAIIAERIDDPSVRAEVVGHVRRRFARGALEVGGAGARWRAPPRGHERRVGGSARSSAPHGGAAAGLAGQAVRNRFARPGA